MSSSLIWLLGTALLSLKNTQLVGFPKINKNFDAAIRQDHCSTVTVCKDFW